MVEAGVAGEAVYVVLEGGVEEDERKQSMDLPHAEALAEADGEGAGMGVVNILAVA